MLLVSNSGGLVYYYLLDSYLMINRIILAVQFCRTFFFVCFILFFELLSCSVFSAGDMKITT